MPTTTAKITSVAEVAGVLKQVQAAFASYQVARNEFINSLTGYLDRQDPSHVTLEALMKHDVIAVLCCPLIADPISGIQAGSLKCLSKLAAAEPLMSQVIVSCGALDSVILSMGHESALVRASSDAVVTIVAKSGEEHATRLLQAGVMPRLVSQLAEPPGPVCEAAVKAVNALVVSGVKHAKQVCDPAMLETLVAMLKGGDAPPALLKAIFSTFGNVSAGTPELAARAVAGGALPAIMAAMSRRGTAPDVRAAAFSCLSQFAKHDGQLAADVARAGALPPAITSLTDTFLPAVRTTAASLLLGIVSKTQELAEAAVAAGIPACLARYMTLESQGEGRLLGVVIAGHISSFGSQLSRALIDANVVPEIVSALSATDVELASSAAWTIEQMTVHGDQLTQPIAAAGAIPALLSLYKRLAEGSDHRAKVKAALKVVVRNCETSGPLEFMVDQATPAEMLKLVLLRMVILLDSTPKARQSYVANGALMRMQKLGGGLHPRAVEAVESINKMFPEEVVAYYQS